MEYDLVTSLSGQPTPGPTGPPIDRTTFSRKIVLFSRIVFVLCLDVYQAYRFISSVTTKQETVSLTDLFWFATTCCHLFLFNLIGYISFHELTYRIFFNWDAESVNLYREISEKAKRQVEAEIAKKEV